MTREEARTWLNKLYTRADITDEYGDMEDMQPYEEAVNMAIKALEQEPCERFEWGIDGNVYKIIKAKDGKEICLRVCEDAINRDMALEKMADYAASGYADSADDFEEYSRIICQLPPVRPQEPTDTWSIKDISDTFKKHGLIREQEPKTGHWKRISIDRYTTHAQYWYKCDKCGEHNLGNTDYCPSCGAKMVEPQESEDK